jgi:aminoglycoside phosphotransferase family enzyme
VNNSDQKEYLVKDYKPAEELREANLVEEVSTSIPLLTQGTKFDIPMRGIMPCLYDLSGQYVIMGDKSTNSAFVFFIKDHETGHDLCLKIWKPLKDDVYNTEHLEDRIQCVIDGLRLNRRFTPDVFLGVARIEGVKDQYIAIEQCDGELELREALSTQMEHALVMRRLPDEWRLDIQLEGRLLDSYEMLDFLAREVAHIHQVLEGSVSVEKMGSIQVLSGKLEKNLALLEQLEGIQNKEYYIRASDILREALHSQRKLFDEREHCHIKHCHGDLKASNLWLRPAAQGQTQKLLLLDCVDFNCPEFCHIDTLSDLAMLAVNLEHSFVHRLGKEEGQKLLQHFLRVYLVYAHENYEKLCPLLEYYMAEKAIVCAYTSHHYDHLSFNVARLYLELAFMHVEKLNAYSQIGSARVG